MRTTDLAKLVILMWCVYAVIMLPLSAVLLVNLLVPFSCSRDVLFRLFKCFSSCGGLAFFCQMVHCFALRDVVRVSSLSLFLFLLCFLL